MERAYDLADLGKRLQAAGLDNAEELAEEAYQEIKEWLQDSARLSATPFDDVLMSFIDQLDNLVLPVIDRLDGQDD